MRVWVRRLCSRRSARIELTLPELNSISMPNVNLFFRREFSAVTFCEVTYFSRGLMPSARSVRAVLYAFLYRLKFSTNDVVFDTIFLSSCLAVLFFCV